MRISDWSSDVCSSDLFAFAVEARRFDFAAIAQRRKVLEAEINADCGGVFGTSAFDQDWDIDVPSPPAVLIKAASSNPYSSGQARMLMHQSKPNPTEFQNFSVKRNMASVEGNPPKRFHPEIGRAHV